MGIKNSKGGPKIEKQIKTESGSAFGVISNNFSFDFKTCLEHC
jgi:hypothetical protein